MRRLVPSLLLLALLAPATATAAPKPIVLSLGDSLAAGFQLDTTGKVVFERGYSGRVADRLGARLVNFGCPGEDTTSFLRGGCIYADLASTPSQMARAAAFLRARRGRVSAVTVSIGAHTFTPCATGGIDLACVASGSQRLEQQLPRILRRLRRAAGKQVRIATLVPYNPFLAFYRGGGDYEQLAVTTNSLARGIANTIAAAARPAQVRVADGLAAFDAFNFDDTGTYAGQTLPRAVVNVCTLTQFCLDGPQNNIHPTASGYARLSRALVQALR